jgi:hypothetical protein
MQKEFTGIKRKFPGNQHYFFQSNEGEIAVLSML